MEINEQYDYMFDPDLPPSELGIMAGTTWRKDPKRLVFTLSRYKFVAKMFAGFDRVLEIGCGDAWASRIVAQSVKCLVASDYDSRFIKAAQGYSTGTWPIQLKHLDLQTAQNRENYNGIYLLDVFEHIHPTEEGVFMEQLKDQLADDGCLIIGIPSLRSQELISPNKRDPGHVNCKGGHELKEVLDRHFKNVFIFSMNDEVVHTGNFEMAHYLIALCCLKYTRKDG